MIGEDLGCYLIVNDEDNFCSALSRTPNGPIGNANRHAHTLVFHNNTGLFHSLEAEHSSNSSKKKSDAYSLNVS